MSAAISLPGSNKHVSPVYHTIALIPVRGVTSAVHFVRATARGELDHKQESLCGTVGPLNARNESRWRRVRSPGETTCMTCASEAVQRPSRVLWS